MNIAILVILWVIGSFFCGIIIGRFIEAGKGF